MLRISPASLLALGLFAGAGSLTAGCPKAREASAPAAAPAALPAAAPAQAEGVGSPLAAAPSGNVSAREILKRAASSASAAVVDLDALAAKPSSAALGKACVGLGELEAYLVSLSYLLSDKLLVFDAPDSGPTPALHQDPRRWVSTAGRLAPLCTRPGSSSDDFASDIAEAKANIAAAVTALVALASKP